MIGSEIEACRLVGQRLEEIVAAWAARRRGDGSGAAIADPALSDSFPELLRALAAGPGDLDRATRGHALARLASGFETSEVFEDYAALRHVLLGALNGGRLALPAFEILETVLDRSLACSLEVRQQETRANLERALARISALSLEVENVDALLPRLLAALVEAIPPADTAALLLVEGERLRMRAAAGVLKERDRAFTLRVGEGFAGRVAATRAPLFLPDASASPLVKSEFIHRHGLRALYGVPLLRGEQLLGVAHVGSLRSCRFAHEDRLLFRLGAGRAALVLVHLRQQCALRDAAEYRDRIIAVASHDIRNPLQAITLSARQIMDQVDGRARVGGQVRRIAGSAQRIAGMLAGLLDYTQARFRGPLGLHPAETDLAQVARQVIDELAVVYPGRPVRLSVEGDVHAVCDPERCAQVLSNLLTNALRYGDAAAGADVLLRGDRGELRLSVRNRGHPIPPEVRQHLFEPFRRGGRARAGKRPGNGGFGLGLYIVEQIARAHGGEVGVVSDERATEFTVRLPRRPVTTAASRS